MSASAIGPPSLRTCAGAVVLLSGLLLSACGGDTGIDAAVTEPLAARADRVAELAEAGDGCGALDELALLRADTTAAVDTGSLPSSATVEVDGVADRIAAGLTCEAEEPDEADESDDDADEDDDEDGDDEDDGCI